MNSGHSLATSVLAFLAALAASLVLTPLVRNFARRRRLIEGAQSVRHVHTRSVPRVGGVAIVAAFFLVTLAAAVLEPGVRAGGMRALALALGGVCTAFLGLVDDLRGMRARYKLAIQFAIGAMLCLAGFIVREMVLPGGVRIQLGYFSAPLTMVWIVGVMNALNLIDGLDGLAGGVGGFALLGIVTLSLAAGLPGLAMQAAALFGAVCGFLAYNFNPASIFMGDTGSLFLGYFLAVGSLAAAQRSGAPLVLSPAPLVLLAVPLVDTSLAIARRALRGRPLFSPDRDHLHHRLLARTSSQRRAVLILYAAGALLTLAALAIHLGGQQVARVVTLLVAAGIAASLHRLGIFAAGINTLLRDRRRNLGLRTTLDAISLRLRHARRLQEVLDSMHLLGPAVSAGRLRVRIGVTIDDRGGQDPSDRTLSMRFLIAQGRQRVGDVEIVWTDGRTMVEADHALAIEGVCENAARAVWRISPETPQLAPTPPLGMPALGRLAR